MQSGGKWRPIGTVLVDAGAIDEAQLQAALAEQKTSGRRLGEILIDSGAITWNALAHAIAAQVEALDADDAPAPAPEPAPPVTPPAPVPVSAAPVAPAPERAIPVVSKVDVASDNRMETLETMLRERQRAFLELVATTETLRRAVAKLQDEVAEKEAEIKRLRLQTVA